MSTDSGDPRERKEVEVELRAALRAAAAAVQPSAQPLTGSLATPDGSFGRRPSVARRWIAPAAVAAAVAAVGVPVLVITSQHTASTASPAAGSTVVTSTGGFATVAGVRFPLPDGWVVRAIDVTTTAVTACVAAHPSAACDGVTIRVAIPDTDGGITPLPDPLDTDPSVAGRGASPGGDAAASDSSSATAVTGSTTTVHGTSEYSTEFATSAAASGSDSAAAGGRSSSGRDDIPITHASSVGTPGDGSAATMPSAAASSYVPLTCPMLVDTDPVGGRPAQHLAIAVGSCAPDSPQSLTWYVADGSLAISTPRGLAAAQATQIAAGVDFADYAHAFGPQVAFAATATAPATTAEPSASTTESTASTSGSSPGSSAAGSTITAATP